MSYAWKARSSSKNSRKNVAFSDKPLAVFRLLSILFLTLAFIGTSSVSSASIDTTVAWRELSDRKLTEVGFDAICLNEHHSNGYGLMPSPNLIASSLARRTTNTAMFNLSCI